MNQGIPSRDIMTDKNGQITTIWLIFFERLYSLYTESSSNNSESIASIKEIADQALSLAKQVGLENDVQKKEIEKLYELITNSTANFATTQELTALDKRVEQTEYDIQQLQIALDKLKNTFDAYQKETKDKFASIQGQINNLAQSKVSEAPTDGKTYGRKDLEWSEIIAVKLSLPFWLSDGQQSNIELTANYQLPFWLSDGTQQNIEMVTV